eukprot:8571599-Pyramimonas_sp.AAC.1
MASPTEHRQLCNVGEHPGRLPPLRPEHAETQVDQARALRLHHVLQRREHAAQRRGGVLHAEARAPLDALQHHLHRNHRQ